MLEQFKKLIEVKSLVTLPLTATFIVLALRGNINSETFMIVLMTVITYFFARKKDGA